MAGEPGIPTAYEILGVQSRAPRELVSAAYWMTVEEIQAQRELGEPVDRALHLVTRAYEKISVADVRAGYNLSIGDTTEPLTTARLPSRRWPFRGRGVEIDHYGVMGLHETAPRKLVVQAYHLMRAMYLRVPVSEGRRVRLLSLLDKARDTLGDERKRFHYDQHRSRMLDRNAAARKSSTPASAVRRLFTMITTILPAGPEHRSPHSPHQTMFARLNLYIERMDSGGASLVD